MTTAAAGGATRAGGWVPGPPAQRVPQMRLVCLPYAGGAAAAYTGWAGNWGAAVEVCPVELPGRQRRWREPAFDRLRPLVDALATALVPEVAGTPYALFGHSMGGLVAFELARELRRRGLGGPVALVVAGAPAPRTRRPGPGVHDQADEVLMAKLRELGGVPEEVFDEPELLELVLPTVRADLAVCETYTYVPQAPLECAVLALSGRDDQEVPPARMANWQAETRGVFVQVVLPGDHFFVETAQACVLEHVSRLLEERE